MDKYKFLLGFFKTRFKYNPNTGMLVYNSNLYQLNTGLSDIQVIEEISNSNMRLIIHA